MAGWFKWTEVKPQEFQVCDFWWPIDERRDVFDWILCGSTPAPAVGWDGKRGQFPSEYWGLYDPPLDRLWWRPSVGLPDEASPGETHVSLSAEDYKRMYEECLKELDEERGASFRLARFTEAVSYAIDKSGDQYAKSEIQDALLMYGDPEASIEDDDEDYI